MLHRAAARPRSRRRRRGPPSLRERLFGFRNSALRVSGGPTDGHDAPDRQRRTTCWTRSAALPDHRATSSSQATDVHKWFGRLHVLKGVSLTVQRREVVVLIGPSGSGKTTFLRCINHLEKIQAGRILVNGHLIGYRERERQAGRGPGARASPVSAQEIGMVFQRFNLFPHLTALENVIEAPIQVRGDERRRGADDRAARCWQRVGLGRTRSTPTRRSSPAASSSASPSPARWPCSRP